MKLVNIQKKSVAFNSEKSIEFFKGDVQDDQDKEIFQYSISTEPYLGYYRATLSFEQGDVRVMSVFQIQLQNQNVNIQAENQAGREIWDNKNHIKHQQIKNSLELILQSHL